MSRGGSIAGVLFFCILFLALVTPAVAQAPIPAATHPASKEEGGFSPGWTLGARLEGDYSVQSAGRRLRRGAMGKSDGDEPRFSLWPRAELQRGRLFA